MNRIDGTVARRLDFDGRPEDVARMRPRLRLAPSMRLTGPDKYKVLDRRRRRAQIRARRLLDLLDGQENGR